MRFGRRLFAVAAATVLAGPVLAQNASQDAAVAQIMAWAKQNDIKDNTGSPPVGWAMLGITTDGLHLATIRSKRDSKGIAKVGVRLERFKPANGTLSEATFYELDCAKAQIKPMSKEAFAKHNLDGAKQAQTVSADWAPSSTDGVVEAVAVEACAAPVPKLSDEKDIRKWMFDNGVQDRALNGQLAWTLLGATPDGVLFTGRNGTNAIAHTAGLILKLERFNPASNQKIGSSLSEQIEYSVNCSTKQLQQLSEARFELHNLAGQSEGNADIGPWTEFDKNPLGKSLEAMCKDFVVQRSMMFNDKGPAP